MKKMIQITIMLIFLISCLFLSGCATNRTHKPLNSEVSQIGMGWIDNMIDAYEKIQNSPNELTKQADIKYLNNCINYYAQTLDHATEEEKRFLNEYFAKETKAKGLTPEVLLKHGDVHYEKN